MKFLSNSSPTGATAAVAPIINNQKYFDFIGWVRYTERDGQDCKTNYIIKHSQNIQFTPYSKSAVINNVLMVKVKELLVCRKTK